MYKILDIFSGAGGFSYGMAMNKKFTVELGVDFNKQALETFSENHKGADTIFGDITDKEIQKEVIRISKARGVNMIIGGPPCQGFSLKGKKLGINDPRNFLFMEFLNLVEKIKPKIFVMENVRSMITSVDGFFIKQIVEKFKKIGYEIDYGILSSEAFGVPQIRKRAIIIGSLNGRILLPKPTTKKIINTYEAISDLNYLESGEKSDGNYQIDPLSDFQKKMRSRSKSLDNHQATNHSELALYKMGLIPEKGTKLDLPEELRGRQKFSTTWSRLHWDKPSPTIDTRFDTPSNGQNIHPILDRAITPREAARLQSFPDSFIFTGKKTSVCRQIGNAVPPLMSLAIADSIAKQSKTVSFKQGDYELIHGDANTAFIPEGFDALITDPPYNISKANNFSTMRNKRTGVDFGDWDKGFDLTGWIERYYKKLKPGGAIIIFTSYLYLGKISEELERLGALTKDVIKWTKTNPMPRNIERRYVQDTEFAIWAVKSGEKWTFNKGSDHKYRRAQFSSATVLGKERTKHPTQKSRILMEELIGIHTNKGDLIIDPFMGSGTTGIAAINLKRRFLGIEKNKDFSEISKKRFIENV